MSEVRYCPSDPMPPPTPACHWNHWNVYMPVENEPVNYIHFANNYKPTMALLGKFNRPPVLFLLHMLYLSVFRSHSSLSMFREMFCFLTPSLTYYTN